MKANLCHNQRHIEHFSRKRLNKTNSLKMPNQNMFYMKDRMACKFDLVNAHKMFLHRITNNSYLNYILYYFIFICRKINNFFYKINLFMITFKEENTRAS